MRRRHRDRAIETGDGARRRSPVWRSFAIAIVGGIMLLAATPALPGAGEAMAQRMVSIGGKRTINVKVPVGKSEDIRTDAPFTEVTVGDPDVADVNPLTDRGLSILGKKIE